MSNFPQCKIKSKCCPPPPPGKLPLHAPVNYILYKVLPKFGALNISTSVESFSGFFSEAIGSGGSGLSDLLELGAPKESRGSDEARGRTEYSATFLKLMQWFFNGFNTNIILLN